MFKFAFSAVFSAAMCFALACPMTAQAQDCGCCDVEPACQKTRKKLVLVDVSKEVCRLKRVCVTDECGCSKSKLARVSECVTRKKLALVDVPVDPCKRGLLSRMGDKLKSIGSCGCSDACDTCGNSGCDSGCGCDTGPSVSYPTDNYSGESYPVESYPVEMGYPMELGLPSEASSIMVPTN